MLRKLLRACLWCLLILFAIGAVAALSDADAGVPVCVFFLLLACVPAYFLFRHRRSEAVPAAAMLDALPEVETFKPQPTLCPHCQTEQRPPGESRSKRKCAACGEVLYCWPNSILYGRALLTEEQSQISEAAQEASSLGIPREALLEKMQRMKPADAIWSSLNEAVTKVVKTGDDSTLLQIYEAQVSLLASENKSSVNVRRAIYAIHFRDFLHQCAGNGVRRAEILINGCPSCDKMNGRIFRIADLKKKMTIPSEDCTCHGTTGCFSPVLD